MRTVNIGFNVETSKAVKSLKDFENKLISIETVIDKINKTGIEPLVPSDNGAKFGQSTKPILKNIGLINEEIRKMRTSLSQSTNLNDKSVLSFTSRLSDLSNKAENLKSILSDKDLLKGMDSKQISKLLVEFKDLNSQTTKIKSTLNGFMDGTIDSIKKLEAMNRKVNLIEDSIKNIKRLSIIEGKLDIKSNADSTLKDIEKIRNDIKSAYSTGDYKSIDLLNNSLSELINKNKILKKDFGKLPDVENVNMKSSISQLEVLQAQLKRLSTIDPTVRLEHGLKDVSKETLKLIVESEKLKQSMASVDDKSDIPNLKAQLIEVRQEFNKLNNAKLEGRPQTNISDLVSTYAVFNTAKAQLSNFMELEDATYNLGVVAQFSEFQIQQMRQSIIDMSTDLPQSSIEITKAMDAVMRTGKSYEEARVIVQKTSKLATASGESLGDAVSIVNKLFLALGVNATKAEDVDRALQQMHATAVFTATDLEGLGESAKQYAGALSTLAKTTSYSGKELDDYKIGLLALGTTFSGILSNMGRSAEQSGEQTLCPFVTRVA